MNDLAILRDLFQKDVLATVEGHEIRLEERDNTRYTLTITRTPRDIIAFKTDMFPDLKRVFKNSRHECRRADYVIVAHSDYRRWIVYVEMKIGKRNSSDIKLQLRGAECLVAYCRAIGQQFWGERGFLEGYTSRFVSVDFASRRHSKRERGIVNDAPEHVLKLSASKRGTLHFNKLLGAARR